MVPAEKIIVALNEVIRLLSVPATKDRLDKAKAVANDDPMQMMVMILPMAVSMMSGVAGKCGFSPDHSGVIQFMIEARLHNNHPEIREKMAKISESLLPPKLLSFAEAMTLDNIPMVPKQLHP